MAAEFTRYLRESAYVIYFTVPDDANAFLIFETMNDRGLDLSIADLLKNYLLGRSGEDLQTILNLWTTAMACLSTYGGENLFTAFLRHYWSSKYGLVREKELYRSIKSRVTTSANVIDFANEVEKVHAHLYQKLLDSLDTARESYSYYVCPVCGFTAEGIPPDNCPICGTKGKMFKEIS